MPTVYDVPADECIREVSEYLQANVPEVSPPEWHGFVKTGAYRERTPEDPNWWYTRSASILRKIYISEPIGISRLQLLYGGKKRSGNAPAHFTRGSGAVIHNILKQLETAGLVETVEGKGRILTKTGKGMLDRCATRIKKRLEKDIPSLKVY